MSSFEITMRTIFSFIVLFIFARILGKKLLSQMTFFDFVAGITLGNLTANTIFMSQVQLWKGLLSLSIFASMSYILGFIAIKSFSSRRLISGVPSLLIKNGKIIEEALRFTRLTLQDLLFLLREKGTFYIDDVEIAIF